MSEGEEAEGLGIEREEEEAWAAHVIDYGYYCPLKSGSIDGTDRLPHDHAIVRALNSTCEFTSSQASSLIQLLFYQTSAISR